MYVLIIHSCYQSCYKELDALRSLILVQKMRKFTSEYVKLKTHRKKKHSERFEPRNHVISKWDMIVRVSLVLLLTSSTDKDRNPVPGIRNPRRGL